MGDKMKTDLDTLRLNFDNVSEDTNKVADVQTKEAQDNLVHTKREMEERMRSLEREVNKAKMDAQAEQQQQLDKLEEEKEREAKAKQAREEENQRKLDEIKKADQKKLDDAAAASKKDASQAKSNLSQKTTGWKAAEMAQEMAQEMNLES